MASPNPLNNASSAITPRPKRAPREKLSYLKCTFCRKAKLKCLPERPRVWPREKCIRCTSKCLECSAPQQARATVPAADTLAVQHSNTLPLHSSIASDHDHETYLESIHGSRLAKDALMLLSIQHLLQMAIEEMYEHLLEVFLPLRGHSVWKKLVEEADRRVKPYQNLIYEIRTQVDSMPPATHRLLLQATQDLAFILSTRRKSDPMFAYESEGYRPFAYILQLSGLRKGMQVKTEEVDALCQNRKAFLEGWSEVFNRYSLHETKGYSRLKYLRVDLLRDQFLTPREALRIPSILEDVRNDGRHDILSRSVAHMEHDAGIRKLWPEDSLYQADWIDRTSLHLACERKDSALLKQLMARGPQKLIAQFDWFRPLDVAVMHGYLEPLIALKEHGEGMFRNAVKYQDGWGLTIMHLAAAAGQVNIVNYLLNHLPSRDLVYTEDVYGRIPSHFAAEAGHLEMLNLLLGEDYSIRYALDRYGHSLSFFAEKGGHTQIRERLEAFDKESSPPLPRSTSPTNPSTSTSPAGSSTPLAPVVATESLTGSHLTGMPEPTSNLNRTVGPWTYTESVEQSSWVLSFVQTGAPG